MHQSVLVFNGFKYFKISMLLVLLAIGVYAFHTPVDGPNGGTWLGYTLGTIGALLILWLMWFGVRKRSYKSNMGRVEGWLSAHVYLGTALIIIATLHAGFQVGWNLHTLAYVLMLIVIGSGMFGVFAYLRYPELMTDNRRGRTMTTMLSEMADLDRECRDVAASLSDEINRAILHSSENTRIGGSIRRQLSGKDPKCATTKAYHQVEQYVENVDPDQAEAARHLLTLLGKKVELVQRARRDVQYKALMDFWLYFHVPLSFGLLAALVTHIVSVFFYW
jgi:hypothetical protein